MIVNYANIRPVPQPPMRCAVKNKQDALIKGFIRNGQIAMPIAQSAPVIFNWQAHKLTHGKGVAVSAKIDRRLAGFAYFELLPAVRGLDIQIAEMDRMPFDFPLYSSLTERKSTSEVALKVFWPFSQRFKGLGTSLVVLCLHLARHFNAPFLQVNEDISIQGSVSGQSFYEYLGFIPGYRLNKALRQFGDIYPHGRTKKVFYLNGMLDGVVFRGAPIEFVIPEVNVITREQYNQIVL